MKPTKEEIAEVGKDQVQWALYDIDENLQSFKIKVLAIAYKEAIDALRVLELSYLPELPDNYLEVKALIKNVLDKAPEDL